MQRETDGQTERHRDSERDRDCVCLRVCVCVHVAIKINKLFGTDGAVLKIREECRVNLSQIHGMWLECYYCT